MNDWVAAAASNTRSRRAQVHRNEFSPVGAARKNGRMAEAPAAAHDASDIVFMRRVQADDCDAFSALYNRFSPRAYSVAYAISRDTTRAEDIVQEAFVSLWRGRARYDTARGSVAAWVMDIVKKRALDSLRHNGRHDHRRADSEHIDEQIAASNDVETTAVECDEAARLRSAVSRLPEAQRHVIALAYFGELSTTEIAAKLSLAHGTVKSRMRLGLNKLRADQF